MFQRVVDGVALRFHLAGINNQNFLMRDEQTGTFWQQITGRAVSGPLAGRQLTLVPADELTFALWKKEQPTGTVLKDAPGFSPDYASRDWDVKMAKARTVLSYAQPGLKPRDLMLGVHVADASRAYPYSSLLKEKVVEDNVGAQPVIVVVGPDNLSVRVFERHIPGLSALPQFYSLLKTGGKTPQDQHMPDALLMDAETGSEWNFQGCAVSGKLKGTCLKQVDAIKDYWFDWRNYNPTTTVYGIKHKID